MSFEDSAEERNVLKRALQLTEIALELKERHSAGEKYVNNLKSLLNGVENAVAALQVTAKSTLGLAQKLLQNKKVPDNYLKQEYESLTAVINREIGTLDLKMVTSDDGLNVDQLTEKIRTLETRHRNSDCSFSQQNPSSSRSSKIDINEKYPENLSKDSLIDLNNVINLPPVPEDIFSSFSNSNKPIRSSSLSSLKSMRKIKLFLQKAESSDDDDSSENDEHDYSKLVYGDNDETKTSKKLHLGYIKEETQD